MESIRKLSAAGAARTLAEYERVPAGDKDAADRLLAALAGTGELLPLWSGRSGDGTREETMSLQYSGLGLWRLVVEPGEPGTETAVPLTQYVYTVEAAGEAPSGGLAWEREARWANGEQATASPEAVARFFLDCYLLTAVPLGPARVLVWKGAAAGTTEDAACVLRWNPGDPVAAHTVRPGSAGRPSPATRHTVRET